MEAEKEHLLQHYSSTSLIDGLRDTLSGRVIAPDDLDYDQTRMIFHGGIDRRPAVIARPVDAADVARVITFARQSGLPFAVRSGGHSGAGHGATDGGMVLDLRDVTTLEVDAVRRTAWAGGRARRARRDNASPSRGQTSSAWWLGVH